MASFELFIHEHSMDESEHCAALGLDGSSRVQQSRGDSLTVLCHLNTQRKVHTLLDSRGSSTCSHHYVKLLFLGLPIT